MREPEEVVKTVTEDGKEVLYMYIDGIKVHEEDPAKQPPPPIITPGTDSTPDTPGTPPSDAIMLFDGGEASMVNWTDTRSEPTKWLVVDGSLESVRGAGMIRTRDSFGSCQLHLEFATPIEVTGFGQGRGNSGVFLMATYEVQVLDSYDNPTYPDGQCGALYGRSKPLANCCRKPGEWQSYDIIFHRPTFDERGKVVQKATFTVLQNGVLIQDHVTLHGGTGWRGFHAASDYAPHADRLPLMLQDHGNPVRFRNIWIRDLDD